MIARVRVVVVALLGSSALLAACTKKNYFECEASADCDFLTGGTCIQNPATGNSWCAAPDATCPSGYRWDATAVGDNVASTCTPPPDAAPISCTPELGWLSRRSGNLNVFAANLDGSNPHALTSNSAQEFRYSPVGDRLVYVRAESATLKTMWLVDSDGDSEDQLTDGYVDIAPEWSNAGDRIVFMRKRPRSTQYDLWIATADTGELTVVASDPALTYEYAAFSPDGTRLAFDAQSSGSVNNLYVMDSDGENVTNLTEDTTAVVTGGYEPPQWAPDGTSLLFTSNRSGDVEIWKASIPIGTLTNLSQSPSTTDDTPRWSADGTTIFFTRFVEAEARLFSMNANGTGQAEIEITGSAEYLYLQPSPDSSAVAWAAAPLGNYEIYTADLVDRTAVRFTNDPATDERPRWRPCSE
jgi:Tol biopolymer transport system component